MDKEKVNESSEERLSAREIRECRSALNREFAPRPDVGEEWRKLNRRLGREAGSRRALRHRTFAIASFAGVAAAVAVIFLVTVGRSVSEPSPNYVFRADEGNGAVTLAGESEPPTAVEEPSMAFDCPKPAVKKAPRMLTLVTPRGKDYHVTLADGTSVWMNADSKLTFPERFAGKRRTVTLEGEAYFEVAPDAKRPFVVKSDFFSVTVLGTVFNMRAYSPSEADVVLVEGSVAVEDNRSGETLSISPGEMAAWSADAPLAVSEVDTYPYTQWREGFFYFENRTLFEIMQELGRWYNVNVAFENPERMEERLHFVADRRRDIGEAVKNLSRLGVAEITYRDHTVLIK